MELRSLAEVEAAPTEDSPNIVATARRRRAAVGQAPGARSLVRAALGLPDVAPVPALPGGEDDDFDVDDFEVEEAGEEGAEVVDAQVADLDGRPAGKPAPTLDELVEESIGLLLGDDTEGDDA